MSESDDREGPVLSEEDLKLEEDLRLNRKIHEGMQRVDLINKVLTYVHGKETHRTLQKRMDDIKAEVVMDTLKLEGLI